MTSLPHNGELLLLAFRYVSGELSASEAEVFESQLAEDAAAQQALADVVQLSEAVAVGAFERANARRQEGVRRRTSRRQVIVAGLSGAVVAGCLFVLAGWLSRHGASPDAEVADVVPVSSQEAHSVVSLWSALGDAAPDPSIADESNVSAADGADATGDEVPDWMLAAVAGVESDDLFDQEPPPHPVPPQDDGDEETL